MEDFNSKYTGQQVEDLLDQVASGNAGGGGGGGITVETDPIFSNSPAATITEADKSAWSGKQDAISDLDKIRSGAEKGATAVQPETLLDYALEGYVDNEVKALGDSLAKVATSGSYDDLSDKPTIPSAINIAGNNYAPSAGGIIDLNPAGLYRKPSGGIPKEDLSSEVQTSLRNAEAYKGTVTGVKINGITKSPSSGVVDLGNIPTSIPSEVYITDFTIDSLRAGVYNGTNVYCDLQGLVNAMNANKVILVREGEDSSYKGVYVLNGYIEDLLYFSIVDTFGNILWCDGTDYISLQYIDAQSLHERRWSDKQDTLKSGENIKTINGESILGSGDIEISGGSGEQGPQGDKGDKGDKGDTGVGVQSVKQTTISNTDGGNNVVTVTLTNGTTSTFTVKNGSKGSTGTNGTNGTNGKDGADGATFTPSVDSAGNLSWTNNKGLANPPTVNIKGPKGDAGEGGGSSGGGKEVVLTSYLYFDDANPVQPNKIYITGTSSFSSTIGAFQEVSDYDEYCIIFKYPEKFYLLESVKFANGQIPTIEYETECELSVVGIGSGANRTYHAVITPFKAL